MIVGDIRLLRAAKVIEARLGTNLRVNEIPWCFMKDDSGVALVSLGRLALSAMRPEQSTVPAL
jgi:hypothetical protein